MDIFEDYYPKQIESYGKDDRMVHRGLATSYSVPNFYRRNVWQFGAILGKKEVRIMEVIAMDPGSFDRAIRNRYIHDLTIADKLRTGTLPASCAVGRLLFVPEQ